MPKKSLFVSLSIACVGAAHADFPDWSSVTLNGSNPFTYTDPLLGEVTLTYSDNFKNEGIVTNWGSTHLIGLGERGTGLGILTVEWENPITSLDIRAYDLDLGERDDFVIQSGTTLSLVEASPFGPANPLSGLRLSGVGSDLPNGATNNYATVRIAGDAFTSFGVEFARPGSEGGGHAISFGEAVVPTPASSILITFGCASASVRRRRH